MTEDEDHMPTAALPATGPARPAQRKLTAADRYAGWLDLHDTGRWSYSRIAAFAGKSIRAVKAGIAKARLNRKSGPTNAEACGDELTRYLETHPQYKDSRVVKDWLRDKSRRPD